MRQLLRRLETRLLGAIQRRLSGSMPAEGHVGWTPEGTFDLGLVEFGPTHHGELDVEVYDGSCGRITQEEAGKLSNALWHFARTGEFRA